MKLFKNIFLKGKNLVSLLCAAIVVSLSSVVAFADPADLSSDPGAWIGETVTTTGTSVLSVVGTMVTALIPLLVGVGMAGLAIVAIGFIFKKVKGFLGKSAG